MNLEYVRATLPTANPLKACDVAPSERVRGSVALSSEIVAHAMRPEA